MSPVRPEPMLYQKLKKLGDEGCPFCSVSALCLNLAYEFAICPKCGAKRYLDGRVTDPLKKGVKKEPPSEVVTVIARRGIEERIDDLEEKMARVLGHLVLD